MKHKLVIFIFFYLLSTNTVFAQSDLFFPLKNEYNLNTHQKLDFKLIDKFKSDLPNEFPYYKKENKNKYSVEIDNCLFVIDLNGDGFDDMIFSGENGGELNTIAIYFNINGTFKKVLQDHERIQRIVFENGKASKIFIQNDGCCCEYITTFKVFEINYEKKIPKIKLSFELQIVQNTEIPNEFFQSAIKFSVRNNNYNIRFSPIIDDTTENYYCGEPKKGNSLGMIPSGSVGYALAQKKDSTGRIWWFSAISPDVNVAESIFYDNEYSPNSYKYGWVSSNFVTTLNE